MARQITVSVKLSITVDADEYEAAYGETSDADIREAIRYGVQSAAATDGVVLSGGIISSVALKERAR